MREPLVPYRGINRFNYLCILAHEMLGEKSLARLPSLLTSFDSVLNTLPSDAAQAIRNLRLARVSVSTWRELALMAHEYQAHHRRIEFRRARNEDVSPTEIDPRYIVDDELNIQPAWTHIMPADVTEAIASLTQVLPERTHNLLPTQIVTAQAEIVATGEKSYQGLISPLGFTPVDVDKYDFDRVGQAPGVVPWIELVNVANDFDSQDVIAGRQEPGLRSWFHRMHDSTGAPSVVLQQVTTGPLTDAAGIDLTGIKHLIGLPGAGKTTLLYLLAGYMAKQDKKACFLFPSIEVASGFLEVLQQYNIPTGLLSGQGKKAKRDHAINFAASLGRRNKGFGETRSTAVNFSTNCALGGFASHEEFPFPHENPPCQVLKQKDRPQKSAVDHSCALASVCGYQFAERQLGHASIVAGHVLSLDRGTSPIFSDLNVRQFEFIAKTFDLLVVDECDAAQTNLDDRGTPVLKLFGATESLWSNLLNDLHGPAARGNNAFVAGSTMPTMIEMTGRFGRASDRFVSRVMHFPKEFQEANSKILLTSLSILADMFEPPENATDEQFEEHYQKRQGLEKIWDAAAKVVAFRLQVIAHPPHHDGEDDGTPSDLERLHDEAAKLMQSTPQDIKDFYTKLLSAIELWERDGNDAAVQVLTNVLRQSPNLTSQHTTHVFICYSALLLSVTLLVMQHFGLAPHLRRLNSDGLVSDGVFSSSPSRDQLAILPESLVGKLSGVRYTISSEGNIDISHVSFAGTPRLLPQRMQTLGQESSSSLAVLLTSATSMLEDSPSFHIDVGPHYVLKRPNAGDGWENSKYHFHPKMDPHDTSVPLRFSGANYSKRERILKSMVDQLLKDKSFSDVEGAIASNDVRNEIRRKAGFIVNSYDQCELIAQHIKDNYPDWKSRIRYLSRGSLLGAKDPLSLTAAEVENLGEDKAWDLLIFPMSAMGRGVNIVFRDGPRQGQAMLGSLFFLTRPHPRTDSLQLIQGLVARSSQQFDSLSFPTLTSALTGLKQARKDATSMVEYLLRMPLQVQRLGDYARPFVANQMIIILQTIGRAMRGDCPAFVYFVDSAWAPLSAKGMPDNERSSMLVMMQSILSSSLRHPNLAFRECYQNLYQSFSKPLNNINKLQK